MHAAGWPSMLNRRLRLGFVRAARLPVGFQLLLLNRAIFSLSREYQGSAGTFWVCGLLARCTWPAFAVPNSALATKGSHQ